MLVSCSKRNDIFNPIVFLLLKILSFKKGDYEVKRE